MKVYKSQRWRVTSVSTNGQRRFITHHVFIGSRAITFHSRMVHPKICAYRSCSVTSCFSSTLLTQITKFMGPTWGPPGSCRPHICPMNLAIRVVLPVQHGRGRYRMPPRPLVLTAISCASIGISAWVSNYIIMNEWDVITHPCPDFKSGLVKQMLKLGHGVANYVLRKYSECDYLCMPESHLNDVSNRGPRALQCRHNEPDGVSNHQPHDYLLNRLFRCRSKKTSKLRVTGDRWIPRTNGQ